MAAEDQHETNRETGLLTRTAKRLFFRKACVAKVQMLSAHFVLLDLLEVTPKLVAWHAGEKIQINVGRGLLNRTYTPVSWDEHRGAFSILVFLHGDGPGCNWARQAKPGDTFDFMGPRRSLELDQNESPVPTILVGDETAFGLAVALNQTQSDHESRFVLEVDSVEEASSVLKQFGVKESALIPRQAYGAQLEALAEKALSWNQVGTHFALTGNARSIRAIKRLLANENVANRQIRVKPYWSPGKTGLD